MRQPYQLVRNHLALFMIGILLSACAAIGLPAPQTFEQNIAVALSVNAEVRATATTLLQTGKIKVADAEWVQKQANQAREGIDAARALKATDLTGASNKLQVATSILQALQAYLVKQQGAK